jgi:hypothetical protein
MTDPTLQSALFPAASPALPARRRIGVGLVSVGWMGRLHTRAYRAVR